MKNMLFQFSEEGVWNLSSLLQKLPSPELVKAAFNKKTMLRFDSVTERRLMPVD